MLLNLKKELDLTVIFISHDMNVIRQIADRVAIMYLGKIVEIGTTDQVFKFPQHPYTRALLSAVPSFDKKDSNIILKGDLPSPTDLPAGCKFHTRCQYCMEKCKEEEPELKTFYEQHRVACFLNDDNNDL